MQKVFLYASFILWTGRFPTLIGCRPLTPPTGEQLSSNEGSCCILVHKVLKKVLKKKLRSHFWPQLLHNLGRNLIHFGIQHLYFLCIFLFFVILDNEPPESFMSNARTVLYCKEIHLVFIFIFVKPLVQSYASSSVQELSSISCFIW